MSEAVYNAAGLGLPVVMTVANRAIGAPINIWNDHSDAMSQRDAGWIQLYAETNQEAADLHIQAFRIAEELSQPGDGVHGRVPAHPRQRAGRHPGQDEVDAFLPPYQPRQVLDPADPVSIGAMVGPEAFTEVRFLADRADAAGPRADPGRRRRLRAPVRPGNRRARPPVPHRRRRADRRRPRLGARHGQGHGRRAPRRRHHGPGRSASPASARSRSEAVRAALGGDRRLRRLVVLERALAPGSGGIVTADLRDGARRRGRQAARAADAIISTVVAGLGGRPVTRKSLRAMLAARGARRAAAVQLPRPADRAGRGRAGADARHPQVRPDARRTCSATSASRRPAHAD